jgi:electron transfer flavoprotein alpha/beta subunit
MKVVVCLEASGPSAAALAALGMALKLGGPVTALSAGPAADGKAVQEACRRGASAAAEVVGATLDGVDAVLLGKALAHAASRLEAQLVLVGARSDGEGRGIVGAAVAHHLRAAYLPHVESLALEGAAEGEVLVTLRSGGRLRRLAVTLPAVLTVGSGPCPAPTGTAVPEVELIAWSSPGEAHRVRRTGIFGTLDRPKRKPQAVNSAGELLRRWRGT